MRTLFILFIASQCLTSFSQFNYNMGISSGLSISGIYKVDRSSYDHGLGRISSNKNSTLPVYGLSQGIFGEVSLSNTSLSFGGFFQQTGQVLEYQSVLKENGIETSRSLSSISFRLEYLQFPLQLESRFRIKKLRPFLTVGIAPSWLMGMRSTRKGFSSFGEEDEEVDYIEHLKNNARISDLQRLEVALLFGGGLYFGKRLSLSIHYLLGPKEIFCIREDTFDLIYCYDYYRNKSIRLSLNLRLKKQNFIPFLKSKN